jgi:hypothetical protein
MQITAVTPAGTAGAATVKVVTAGGMANAPGAYMYVPAPAISIVVPNAGPEAGSTIVIITGTNFAGATSVSFGAAPAITFTVNSDTQITAVAGPGTGTVDISVSTPGGTATAASFFTYIPAPAISSVTPNEGPEIGGTTVIVTGQNLSGTVIVNFGGTPATSFTVDSATQITAVAPAGFGVVDVTVGTVVGPATAVGAYTYVPAPIVTSVSGAAGPEIGGATVIIDGAYFAGATSVSFGGVPAADFVIVSCTQISATTPPGSGTVAVSVTTASGTGTAVGGYTYVPAPTISAVVPPVGPESGGTMVIVTGTGLTGATSVTFAGTDAPSFTVDSNTQITAVTPAGTGIADVSVSTVGGTETAVGAYTYIPAPEIASFALTVGPEFGNATVVITGTNLTGTTAVTFGATPAIAFRVDSDTQITATTPAGTGAVGISVTTAGGTATAGSYTYAPVPTISSITPAAGPEAGDAAVTITGTGFTHTTAVTIGTTAATSFTIVSDTQVRATTPAGTGAVSISVTTAGGTATAGTYTYAPVPTISSIIPEVGPVAGGSTVTITGTNLSTVESVTFDGIPSATLTVISNTQITAIAPAGTGTVDVSVVTAGGAATAVGAFTYAPAPAISSVEPWKGSDAGGDTVIITGTNLSSTMYVTFGENLAVISAITDTQITATTPAGIPGPVDVSVTTVGGKAIAAGAYLYFSAPTISSVYPTMGPEAGGTRVTISGASFSTATAVTFGGMPATSFAVVDDTQIEATAPAGAGSVDVSVTTIGGSDNVKGAYTYVPVPTVATANPYAGPEAGGATVTITGTNLSSATNVTFGGIAATFIVTSDTQITATTPAGFAGAADIVVTTMGGMATAVGAYTYAAAPTIASVSPTAGPETEGVIVTITGTNFTGATAVTFGETPTSTFEIDTATQIRAVVPAGTGTVDVSVSTAGGTATLAGAFTYIPAPTIASVSPSAGPLAGGTMVTITGTGLSGATSVTFGATPATYFTVDSATRVRAFAPAGTGTVDISVTTAGGAATCAGAYAYLPVPTISSVSPTSGPQDGGTTVVITGTNYTNVVSVTFGGAMVPTFTVDSSTQITAVTPSGILGAVYVSVTTAGGTTTSMDAYTYLPIPVPTITSVSPIKGCDAGGTTVTITGTDLTGTTSVTFGGTAATFTVDSGTQITATTPAGTAGTVDVSVTTSGGTATATGAYTYVPAPTIASISPTAGPESGGTTVIITGTDLTGTTSVTFGGTAATLTVDSSTQITATAPAGTAGTVDVAVTTAGGTETAAGAYTYIAAPTISSVTPNSGSVSGGNAVTIAGTGFAGATAVKFGGYDAWSFTVESSSRITATVPPMPAGTVDVAVTTPGGTATRAGAYQYSTVSITSFDTSQGYLIILGTGFTGLMDVQINGESAIYPVEVDDNEVCVEIPSGLMPGTVSVTVISVQGTATGSFMYQPM